MGKTRLYLRAKKKNADGKSLLYVRYSHGGKVCYFSTGENIEPQFWNAKEELVKKSYQGFSVLNDYLHSMKLEIEEIRLRFLTSRVEPKIELVKNEFRKRRDHIARDREFLLDYWPDFIDHQREVKRIRVGTLKQYNSTLWRLQCFEEFAKTKLTFEAINQDFVDQLTSYLFNLNNSNSTIGGKVKQIKTFMQWATLKGLTTNMKFKEFKKLNNRTDIVTITQEQLNTLFVLDLSSNQKLEEIRDMFILGCATGLRFSDLMRLGPANIKGNCIQIATLKTNTVVRIPINDYSRAILLKYEKLPRVSNPTMNLYIKEVAQIAGFNELHEITSYKGGYITTIVKPLYQLITTHTMRRVFATQSLQRGMQAQDVIRLTGHSSLRTFQPYLHASDQRLESEVAKAWNTAPRPHRMIDETTD